MLLKLAIGDAYGAGFEYSPPDFVATHNNLSGYVQHPTHQIAPGCYTDDTQMSIAIAEVMLSDNWSREALADAFVNAFHRDRRVGYAGRFYDFLVRCTCGADFLKDIRPNSDKSGGAMRAVPVGLLPDLKEVRSRAEMQARITHDTDDGANAAVATALMCHYYRYNLGKTADLPAFLKARVAGDWDVAWTGKVGDKGWMAVRAAITALLHTSTQSSLLKQCIAFTGDVDTVATIALGVASFSSDHSDDLPPILTSDLENGAFGRDYLLSLDERLLTKFAR